MVRWVLGPDLCPPPNSVTQVTTGAYPRAHTGDEVHSMDNVAQRWPTETWHQDYQIQTILSVKDVFNGRLGVSLNPSDVPQWVNLVFSTGHDPGT